MPWQSEEAHTFGRLRAELEADGALLGLFDMLIGAHALTVGATLVTRDNAFERVPNLVIEDWAD